MSIDFAPPLDYVEPKRVKKVEKKENEDLNNPFRGTGTRIDGRKLRPSQLKKKEVAEYDPR